MRVTFWRAYGSSALLIEQAGEKICHVTHHRSSPEADAALAAAASGAILLVFPGGWEEGLALKKRAGVTLLALANGPDAQPKDGSAEAAARKSANVFFARHKMSLDL